MWPFKKKTKQTLWVFCPGCKNDLCSNGSFKKDTDYVYYKCTVCQRESKWDFDTFGPMPVEVDEKGNYVLPKAINSTESPSVAAAETGIGGSYE